MYNPKPFEVTDKEKIYAFIDDNGFGQLNSNSDNQILASHIPFLLSADKTKLVGHLARGNRQTKTLDGQEVLVTLQGAHDYISPSWYCEPKGAVPTWNYQAVHIRGRCKIFNDPDSLEAVVDALTQKYESEFLKPWIPDYAVSKLRAIVGIEISISEIECKFKLSQNRSDQDRQKVITKLHGRKAIKLADAMERYNDTGN